jgi:bisphosphoglycerate-dependent phosphoglycerate mutase
MTDIPLQTSYLGNKYEKSNMKIIICGTHNNRLECFFTKINKNNNYVSKKFNNCAIIKCYKHDNFVRFNMIYQGEKYGSSNISCINSNCWNIREFNNYFNSLTSYSYNINIPDNVEIFFIRHAEGIHNRANLFQHIFTNLFDPSLTEDGVLQAERAGVFLKGYLNYTNLQINFNASHLIRTQQTIGIIMMKMNQNKNIYIVPCAHEIIYTGTGDCDDSLLQYIPIQSNTPKCSYSNMSDECKTLTKFSINEDLYKNQKFYLNWEYYMNYYKNNKKCHETNILEEILNNNEYYSNQ